MVFLQTYIILGLLYASYILLFQGDKWYWFPVNALFGPINIIVILLGVLRRKPTL